MVNVIRAENEFCPCGSGVNSDLCCLAVMSGQKQAKSAEKLMRSRYSAYSLGNVEYILSSWHSQTRPSQVNLENDVSWTGLRVISAPEPQLKEGQLIAYVEFIASYHHQGVVGQMHERSRFMQEQGNWRYVDGEQLNGALKKPGRNDPCHCGSGKKYKKCCGKSAD